MFCKWMRCARKARYKRESSERVVRCRSASDSCLCRLDNTEVGDQRGLPLRAQLPRSHRQLTGRPVKVRRLLSRERGLVRKGTVSTRDDRVSWGDSRKARTLGQALRFELGENSRCTVSVLDRSLVVLSKRGEGRERSACAHGSSAGLACLGRASSLVHLRQSTKRASSTTCNDTPPESRTHLLSQKLRECHVLHVEQILEVEVVHLGCGREASVAA